MLIFELQCTCIFTQIISRARTSNYPTSSYNLDVHLWPSKLLQVSVMSFPALLCNVVGRQRTQVLGASQPLYRKTFFNFNSSDRLELFMREDSVASTVVNAGSFDYNKFYYRINSSEQYKELRICSEEQ